LAAANLLGQAQRSEEERAADLKKRVVAALQVPAGSTVADGGLTEAARSRLLPEPSQEFIEGHAIHPARNRRRYAIEHKRLQPLSLRDFFNHNQIIHIGPFNV